MYARAIAVSVKPADIGGIVPVSYPPRIRPKLANRAIVRYLPSPVAVPPISGGFVAVRTSRAVCQLLTCFLGIYSPVPNWLAAVFIMSRKSSKAVSRSLYTLTGLAWRVWDSYTPGTS